MTVDGRQAWYAECAVEPCSFSNMFPGKEVMVNSICRRQTREPVELALRDGEVLCLQVGPPEERLFQMVELALRDGEVLGCTPQTLRVHLGFPLSRSFDDIIGWSSYNSFFSSEEAREEWRKSHPEVKGITRSRVEIAAWIHNIIGSRLPYDYQLTLPLLKAMLNLKAYGFTKPLPRLGGVRVPDMFLFNIPGFFIGMRRNGYRPYVRFSLM